MKHEHLPSPADLDARLDGIFALPNAFGRAEAEQAAAVIILTLSSLRSEWGPVKLKDVRDFVVGTNGDGRFRAFRNPFFRPDPWELERLGFATVKDGEIELTEEAIRRCCHALGLLEATL